MNENAICIILQRKIKRLLYKDFQELQNSIAKNIPYNTDSLSFVDMHIF